jgi:predicted aldo/keto reductase-like oxidoreductase
MTKMEHIEENIATFKSFKPLMDSEFAALESAAQEFVESDYIQCNKCNYCMPCPYGLDIPAILTFYNDYLSPKERKAYSLKKSLSIYDKLIPDELRRAEHCTGCGRCNPHCPQQINVSEEVFKIAQLIENIKDKVFEDE